jgi:hypothetical protein
MENYIRACFCVKHFLDLSDLEQLQETLRAHACISSTAPTMNLGIWIEQGFTWYSMSQTWKIRIFQLSLPENRSVMVSLDVEDSIFLKGSEICYSPNKDPLFIAYTCLLKDFIKQIDPIIGVIDWDAELMCSTLTLNSFATWGNYLSYQFLSYWSENDRGMIVNIVDELIEIERTGVLIFNHPLGYADGKTTHLQFWSLIKKYIKALE